MTSNESRRIPPQFAGWGIVLVAGLALWLAGLFSGESFRAWQALLVNFLFFTPLAAGLVVWTAIVLAARGTWMGRAEALAARGRAFALPSLAALLLLWAGSRSWSPWLGAELPQGPWLQTDFVLGRDLAALAAFWYAARWYRRRRRPAGDRGAAAVLVLVYCAVFSLLGFDLVMALDPHWASSLFGAYFFISGLYIAVATWALMAAWRGRSEKDRLHDLGKLLLAFSILTTYMFYCQLIPIYYENLPRETRFLVPRMNFEPWSTVSAGLVAVVYLGPLLLLLTIWAKRHRAWLGGVAALILAGMWVERWWLVAPTLGRPLRFGLPELGATLALLGLLGASLSLGVQEPEPTEEPS